ncbi:hypothetical protein L1987_06761 [Smallanthus sonchifolius]|uniref:Uncharacterized protein n=1 Tax=Smallanthus sonchifolius TaxID=185202 RepID=A0ACB9JZ81_9ASTR|nr:hypothetical protein L1987_06761 [Smallanthus sonchifolius]
MAETVQSWQRGSGGDRRGVVVVEFWSASAAVEICSAIKEGGETSLMYDLGKMDARYGVQGTTRILGRCMR